jgi:uncharacterized OB-fold protein
MEWDEVSAHGRIYSWTTLYRKFHPGFHDLPLTVAVIELDEGPEFLVVARISNAAPDEANLYMGCPVDIKFEHLPAGLALPFAIAVNSDALVKSPSRLGT